eukprot:7310266-Prorocentrum_lima.AAC.1
MRNGTGSTLVCSEEENKCPMEEVVAIDFDKGQCCKGECCEVQGEVLDLPSCDGADPVEPSSTLQWGVPGEAQEGEAE